MRLCAVFPSTHQALRLDFLLREESIPHSVIPTPRWISEACGVAIAFHESYRERAVELVAREGVQLTGIFPLEPERGRYQALPDPPGGGSG
ncbi:MAG: DUF3343 domain-containing protein [Bacillota bacterium]|nr:DUF3343 domain-containing protein [Bacillota bacterium]MDI7250350.1 DUF3343 domain-containing protein [Bacillota bacterium]